MSIYGGPDIITDGLVLHLDAANSKSYPGSGNTWFNLRDNNYHGTLTNGPTFSDANKGSIVFDGANDQIVLGNVLTLNTNPFTLEFFAQRTAGGNLYGRVASKGYYLSNGWTFYFGTNPSNATTIGFQFGNPWTSLNGPTVSLNRYYHGVVTRQANLLSMYIDGLLFNTLTTTHNFNTTEDYRIGANSYAGEVFTGNIAVWRHYNRALSLAEIQQNYYATKGRYGL